MKRTHLSTALRAWPKFLRASLGIALVAGWSTSAHAADPLADACGPDESARWADSAIPSSARDPFRALVEGDSRGAEALLNATTGTSFSKSLPPAFAAYWRARAQLAAGLPHRAWDGFAQAATDLNATSPAARTAQLSALQCLANLHDREPGLELPSALASRLPALARSAGDLAARTAVWRLATDYALEFAAGGVPVPASLLGALRDSGAYLELTTGVRAAQSSDHAGAIRALGDFLGDDVPKALAKHLDHARLLLARSYYAVGKYDLAIAQYRQVTKSSNELVPALSELAWAYLLQGKYREAVGIEQSFELGSLTRAYAPEAGLVAAMSLNEICQYPASLAAVQKFRATYGAAAQWLQAHQRDGALYAKALAFAQNVKSGGQAPAQIAGEWARSNVFLAEQGKISMLYREERTANALTRELQQLQPKFPRPAGEALISLSSLPSEARGLRARAVARIEADLSARSERMRAQLSDNATNARLVEIEILNGASHDMIWQNAHPEYKALAQEWSKQFFVEPRGSQNWKWGNLHFTPATKAHAEVWDDEVGALQAKLFDNCSSKARYLTLHTAKR